MVKLPNWGERAIRAKPSLLMHEPCQSPARLGDQRALPSWTSARLGFTELTPNSAWLGSLPSLSATTQGGRRPIVPLAISGCHIEWWTLRGV